MLFDWTSFLLHFFTQLFSFNLIFLQQLGLILLMPVNFLSVLLRLSRIIQVLNWKDTGYLLYKYYKYDAGYSKNLSRLRLRYEIWIYSDKKKAEEADSLGLCDLRNPLMGDRLNILQCIFVSKGNTNMGSCKRVNIWQKYPFSLSSPHEKILQL